MSKGNVRQSNLSFFEPIKLVVKAPIDADDITLDESVTYPFTIEKVTYSTESGTVDFNLRIDGVTSDIAGVSASSTQGVEEPTGGVTVAAGEKLSVYLFNNSNASFLSIKIEGVYGS